MSLNAMLAYGIFALSGTFILLFLSSAAFHLWSTFHGARTPFVGSPRYMVRSLSKLFSINRNSYVYDLGCGDGRVLRSLHRSFPEAHYVGIENDLFPYLLARIRNMDISSESFVLKRKNFFNEGTSKATHVMVYLFPEVMDQLLPKFEKELKPGTILASFDFAFNGKAPEKIIASSELKGHRILLYRF